MQAAILKLIADLPDPDAARRFLEMLAENHRRDSTKLEKNAALLADVATLAAFSPLLSATLLQNPEYLWWLGRKRAGTGVYGKEDLLESLGRFSLTNSQVEPQVLFARFRRRELLRIYLRDIRGLATIAEITEEISNLADAILEYSLNLARREMDNRFGAPRETDEKGRSLNARFCIAALGKLGSRELNYSSDIDLIFLYSSEGATTGGNRGTVTNREYFVKLAEYATKLIAEPGGEGAAYRVDLRLRPHGTLGTLALTVNDTVRYYRGEARPWERQVLIRSRGCAGDIELFRQFFASVEDLVFSSGETVESALANVHRSKEKIDLENINRRGFNVKLSRGGVREIEFIAQALQLAHAGRDPWLRSPHTLISLARLADRGHIAEAELSELSTGYEFLRRTEHVLQMENGLQTHTVPDDPEKRSLLACRMNFAAGSDFERDLKLHSRNVSRVFTRVFGESTSPGPERTAKARQPGAADRSRAHILASIEKSDAAIDLDADGIAVVDRVAAVSPHFAAMLAANPQLAVQLTTPGDEFNEPDYMAEMTKAVALEVNLKGRLSAMRRAWSRFLLEIAVRDIFEKITIRDAKRLQTLLSEASIAAAIKTVRLELAAKHGIDGDALRLAILALGKLGGRGLDYDSDLDLLIVYDDMLPCPAAGATLAEFYGRAVEMFVTALSSMTRDGNLYRVDLRLRPYGSKGLSAMSRGSFLEYMRETAVIWEMLAFVKLRGVGGDMELAADVRKKARAVIHERAVNAGAEALREETLRVRLALEQKHSQARRGREIDIKYGPGGSLDVYFAMRFLQLRDNVPDDADDRSTAFMLNKLFQNGSLSKNEFNDLSAGYEFLSTLDHNLRLTVGRTTKLPIGKQSALATVAARMGLESPADLLEQLTVHRLSIRAAFDAVVADIRTV